MSGNGADENEWARHRTRSGYPAYCAGTEYDAAPSLRSSGTCARRASLRCAFVCATTCDSKSREGDRGERTLPQQKLRKPLGSAASGPKCLRILAQWSLNPVWMTPLVKYRGPGPSGRPFRLRCRTLSPEERLKLLRIWGTIVTPYISISTETALRRMLTRHVRVLIPLRRFPTALFACQGPTSASAQTPS